MIIECPECSTRYDLPVDLPAGGRKVRCASCSHVWHATPEDANDLVLATHDDPFESQDVADDPLVERESEEYEIPPLVPDSQFNNELEFRESVDSGSISQAEMRENEAVFAPPEPFPEPRREDLPNTQDDIGALFGGSAEEPSNSEFDAHQDFPNFDPDPVEFAEPEPDLADSLVDLSEDDVDEIGEISLEPEDEEFEDDRSDQAMPSAFRKQPHEDASFIEPDPGDVVINNHVGSKKAFIAAGWGVLAATALIIFSVGYFNREAVVRAVPGMAGLYNSLGIVVNTRGLEFHEVSYTWEIESGRPVLQVKGMILNITNEPKTVPTVVFALRDDAGEELFHWAKNVVNEPLDAGKRAPFLARIPSPPTAVRSLQVRFAKVR